MIRIIKCKNNFRVKYIGKDKSYFNTLSERIFSHSDFTVDKNTYELIYDNLHYDSFIKSFKLKKKIVYNMKLQPYPYQKDAIELSIKKKNLLVCYPCGAGKSCIGIGAYIRAKEEGIIKGCGLIIVKASLKTQWHKEISKFSDLKSKVIQTESDCKQYINSKIKSRRNKIKSLESKKDIEILKKEINALMKEADKVFYDQFKDSDLLILNYETLKDPAVREILHNIRPEFIMADEVHCVKNKSSVRSKALYEFSDATMKIGATATPVGKNPEDLFGIFSFVDPTIFPSEKSFNASYIKFYSYGRKSFKNLDKLRRQIQSSLIVKSKHDISDQLPSLVTIQRYCDFSLNQAEKHEVIMSKIEDLKREEESIASRAKSEVELRSNPDYLRIEGLILAHQTFAQQLANSEDLFKISDSIMSKEFITGDKSNKMSLLKDLVKEIIESDEKVVIFSKFKKMQDIITEEFNKSFPDAKIAYVNGELSHTQRYKEVYDKFRDKEEYKILLSSDAGCEGLNLNKCKYMIEYDIAESYQKQTQRWGRLERADSVHDNVFVYQLITNESWDEVALKIVQKKEQYDIDLIN